MGTWALCNHGQHGVGSVVIFFFQAEDGIRDYKVTGVQTCALPISAMAMILIDKNVMVPMRDGMRLATDVYRLDGAAPAPVLLSRTPYDKEHALVGRSGERRVGEEGRFRWGAYHLKKKKKEINVDAR